MGRVPFCQIWPQEGESTSFQECEGQTCAVWPGYQKNVSCWRLSDSVPLKQQLRF